MKILTFDEFVNENRRSYSRLLHHQKVDPFLVIMSVERSPFKLGSEHLNPTHDQKLQKEIEIDRDHVSKIGMKINRENTQQFRRELSSLKCGYIPVEGTYNEYNPVRKEYEKVTEHSQIIYTSEQNKDDVFDKCLDWANRTNQDSILIAHKGRGCLHYLDRSKPHEKLGDFHPEKIGEFCTLLHKDSKDHYRTKYFEFSNEKIANKIRQFMNDE